MWRHTRNESCTVGALTNIRFTCTNLRRVIPINFSSFFFLVYLYLIIIYLSSYYHFTSKLYLWFLHSKIINAFFRHYSTFNGSTIKKEHRVLQTLTCRVTRSELFTNWSTERGRCVISKCLKETYSRASIHQILRCFVIWFIKYQRRTLVTYAQM